MQLKKWYFCINERGFKGSAEMIRVAVNSARENTDLTPYCIYNGNDQAHLEAIDALGVSVIQHKSGFEEALKVGYGEKFETFSGHWLRVDIPLIEMEEDFVLYTDNDVMFMAPPHVDSEPSFLAAAPEFDLTNLSYFSSGVMILNVAEMRRTYGDFVAEIKLRLGKNFRYPAHDQESYNRFYGKKFDYLDPAMNWKPFLGLNTEARIIHFHGPKPLHASKLAAGEGEKFMPIYRELWSKSPTAYAHYGNLYNHFKQAGRSFSKG